jgi:hypothetical protein
VRNARTPLGSVSGGRRWLRLRRIGIALALVAGLALALTPADSIADSGGVSISYSIDGIAGTNNWYRGSTHGNFVVLKWVVTDPNSQVIRSSGCENAIQLAGPQAGTTRTCAVTLADNSIVSRQTSTIKIDADPPTGIGAGAARPPDANGWYNHPVAVGWHGSDATSGIAGCTSLTFPGPGLDAASLGGVCTDNAGNTAAAPFSLQYDATPPAVSAISVTSGEGDNIVRWRSTSPGDVAVVKRVARGSKSERVVFQGAAASFTDRAIQSGVEYRYYVQTYDQAANASAVVSKLALPRVVTFGSAYVPRTPGAPVLGWRKVSRASYYHVQLFRNGRRILAAWPLGTKLALHTTWKWNGRRYRLSPGRYGWYAWAGFGRRAAAHYKLLGRATFIVTRGK